ncbi:MAG: hypothetical protein ABJA37_08530 [Ferruginibacter sp.]
MNHDYEPTEFSKSLLAGVFAGIAATVITLVYNFYFRGSTGFSLSEIINVSTIIFVSILLMTVAGLFFYLFHHYFKKGTVIYIVVFVVLTLLAVYGSFNVQRSPNPLLSAEFRQLLLGVIIIYGVFASFIIPYLYNSKKI